jgi:superfamily II DNA or RNA helicase
MHEAYERRGRYIAASTLLPSSPRKESQQLIIFGSPQSVCNGIRNQEDISPVAVLTLIIIDEAHNFDHLDSNTMYQRIVHHYGLHAQTYQYSYRVIGLTGTPFRGKGNSIIGDDQFFREEVCNISASWLINEGFPNKAQSSASRKPKVTTSRRLGLIPWVSFRAANYRL